MRRTLAIITATTRLVPLKPKADMDFIANSENQRYFEDVPDLHQVGSESLRYSTVNNDDNINCYCYYY